MSPKYSYYLLTACVSALAISNFGIITTKANAGFDWTPPEQQQQAPVIQDDSMPVKKGSALPVPPAVVEEELLQTPPKPITAAPTIKNQPPIKAAQPVLKTKTIDQTKTTQNQEIKTKTNTASAPQIKTLSPKKTAVASTTPQQATPVLQTPPAQEAKITPDPVQTTSVPRRKKPKMPVPVKQASSTSAANETNSNSDIINNSASPINNVNNQQLAMEQPKQLSSTIAPDPQSITMTPEPAPIQEEQPKTTSLKINPFPGKKLPSEQYSKNGKEDPQDIGERALQSVYGAKDIEPSADKNSSGFSIVEGFGSDMPLAIALGQIVPPNYAYSFGDGVNPGQKISWNGGKPWNDVLSETLKPLGITFEIDENKIVLINEGSTTARQNSQMKNNDPETSRIKKKLN